MTTKLPRGIVLGVAVLGTAAQAQVPTLQLVDARALEVALTVRIGAQDPGQEAVPPRQGCFGRTTPGRPGRPASCRLIAVQSHALVMTEARVEMPLILQGATHRFYERTLKVDLRRGFVADPDIQQRASLQSGLPLGVQAVRLPLDGLLARSGGVPGGTLEWRIGGTVVVHSTRLVNEHAFAEPDWPASWAPDLADALAPQTYIESDAPIFAGAVRHVAGDWLRDVPVLYTAKALIRHALEEIQLSGDGNEYCEDRLKRYDVAGALTAVQKRSGAVPDLVCAVVALLRAAEIPARPVIGVTTDSGLTAFHTWGELYVPGVGWVPFDVARIRRRRSFLGDVREPWDGLGTIPDLNEYVPVSYLFRLPTDDVEYPSPGLWAWGRVLRAPHLVQYVELDRRPARVPPAGPK